MTSQLFAAVPVFDGSNWPLWNPAMESFLLSQGQWHTVTSEDAEDAATVCPVVPTLTADNAEEVKDTISERKN